MGKNGRLAKRDQGNVGKPFQGKGLPGKTMPWAGKDSPLGSGLGAMGPGALGICCLVRKNITSGKAGLSKQEEGMGTSRRWGRLEGPIAAKDG
jgi:hypothetical protein